MTNLNPTPACTAGIDVQSDEFATACFKADGLEARAKGFYAAARELRGKFDISVHIAPSGEPGRFSVLTRIGGQYTSSRLASSPEEASQLAYLIIQGFRPPLRLPPFGTPVDQTQFESAPAPAGSGQVE